MILVDIGNVQFYQSPKAVGTSKDEQPAISSLCPFTTLESSKKGEKTFLNLDWIKNLDMTSLLLFDAAKDTVLLIV